MGEITAEQIAAVGYLVAAALFILGVKGLARPRTAVRGNLLGATGMLVAIVVTLADRQIVEPIVLAAGLVVGAAIGVALATRVQMTGMPELVALFNGFGGGASVLVGAASFITAVDDGTDSTQSAVAAALTVVIGAVTFSGSLVAVAKLMERLGTPIAQSGPLRTVNLALVAGATAAGAAIVIQPAVEGWMWAAIAVGLVLGVLVVVPIGGADMPVVIALLNSLSGLAAATTGFVIDNSVLIVAGSLVGASGLILTRIMCQAMNRTLFDVVFGSMGATGSGPDADDVYGGRITSTSADEVAMVLEGASRVSIIPGYGMAVAQAQHAVRDLTRSLQDRGSEVTFAIHPVAGRMPGHMNVLLAEAEIPYEKLIEMDEANPAFAQTDVAIVIGANDVVNPGARTDPDSPIAGMPILDADKARTVVVVKRSLSPGFAGIPNPLFANDNTLMLFGDGKQAITEITRSLAEL